MPLTRLFPDGVGSPRRWHPYCAGKALTIIREPASTPDAAALALQALGWVLSDGPRAERFLSLTGLTPEQLRAGLGDTSILGAVLDFLANHEADLVSASVALDISPAAIIAARKDLV